MGVKEPNQSSNRWNKVKAKPQTSPDPPPKQKLEDRLEELESQVRRLEDRLSELEHKVNSLQAQLKYNLYCED